ncbi:unnamed protein product, partial [Brassica rapa]
KESFTRSEIIHVPRTQNTKADNLARSVRKQTSFVIIHVPRTQNTKADNLARSVRKQTSFVVHMDQYLPVWFTESI